MKTIIAALLILGGLAAVLCGWGLSGWQAVEHEQAMVRAQAHADAAARARVAAEVAARTLERIRQQESSRPYFHYQNLFHDPRGSDTDSVAPSPLAAGPDDAVIAGHFQLRATKTGAYDVTVPTINDSFPELSAPERLVADGARRDRLRRLAPVVVAAAPAVMDHDPSTPMVAVATLPQAARTPTLRRVPSPQAQAQAQLPEQSQVLNLSSGQYLQNSMPEQIYGQTRAATPTKVEPAKTDAAPARKATPPAPNTTTTITITVPPLQWVALADPDDANAPPQVLALRQVDTPEGVLVQGFEVDRAALQTLLRNDVGAPPERYLDGDYGVALVDTGAATNPADSVAIPLDALPWAVPIDDQLDQRMAAPRLDALASGFTGRFVPIAILATACGLLGIVVVARAERLAHERARFAAAAAHELRTPLAGIQLYGDMLAGGLGDARKASTYAGRIAEDAARLGRVVANVLGFAQLERGNLSVVVRSADARASAAQALDRGHAGLTRAGATAMLVDGPPVAALLDEDAVARVLGNLLDNAEKYGRDATDRRIEVTVVQRGDLVEIGVRDHGPGVTSASARRLFRAFARGVSSDGPNGLGLGLALSRSLARAMGGNLGYRRPSDGRGALFVLTLRAAPVDKA